MIITKKRREKKQQFKRVNRVWRIFYCHLDHPLILIHLFANFKQIPSPPIYTKTNGILYIFSLSISTFIQNVIDFHFCIYPHNIQTIENTQKKIGINKMKIYSIKDEVLWGVGVTSKKG